MVDIADLERRVIALEAAQGENTKTLNWIVGTLGRVAGDVSAMKEDVRWIKADIAGLRSDLPQMLSEAVRDGLKESRAETRD